MQIGHGVSAGSISVRGVEEQAVRTRSDDPTIDSDSIAKSRYDGFPQWYDNTNATAKSWSETAPST